MKLVQIFPTSVNFAIFNQNEASIRFLSDLAPAQRVKSKIASRLAKRGRERSVCIRASWILVLTTGGKKFESRERERERERPRAALEMRETRGEILGASRLEKVKSIRCVCGRNSAQGRGAKFKRHEPLSAAKRTRWPSFRASRLPKLCLPVLVVRLLSPRWIDPTVIHRSPFPSVERKNENPWTVNDQPSRIFSTLSVTDFHQTALQSERLNFQWRVRRWRKVWRNARQSNRRLNLIIVSWIVETRNLLLRELINEKILSAINNDDGM